MEKYSTWELIDKTLLLKVVKPSWLWLTAEMCDVKKQEDHNKMEIRGKRVPLQSSYNVQFTGQVGGYNPVLPEKFITSKYL